MKNQREIYEVLLAGETLTSKLGVCVKMDKEGVILTKFTRDDRYAETRNAWQFSEPEGWSIYTPPKEKKAFYQWYHKKTGIICARLFSEEHADLLGDLMVSPESFEKFGEPVWIEIE